MSKRRWLAAGVLAALAAAGAAAWYMNRGDGAGNVLILYGNVDIREVDLGFRVGGRLSEVTVDEGDRVVPGQQVARLDGEPYSEALAAAEARVARARANLDKLRAGSRPQEIRRAQAEVAGARADLDNAERELAREQEMMEDDASSERALDATRARRDSGAARLAATESGLALLQEGFRAEDIAVGEAELAAAGAALEQARTRLADTELASPAAATVLTRVREPGTMLAQGQPVLTLSLRDPVYVRAWVAEPDLGLVAPGETAWITTDSSDRRYRGQIGFVSPRAEFTPRSVETTELRTDLVYRLRIVVEDADEGLRQGMPVTVEVALGGRGQP